MPAQRQISQVIVILGFSMTALSAVIEYVVSVTSLGYRFSSFREIIDPMLYPLITLVAIVAWLWLTRIDPRDDAQRRILNKAFFAFAVQYLLYTGAYAFIIIPLRSFGGFWSTSSVWLSFTGAGVTALGLVLFAGVLRRLRFDEIDPEVVVDIPELVADIEEP
jgi:hypothetical protein